MPAQAFAVGACPQVPQKRRPSIGTAVINDDLHDQDCKLATVSTAHVRTMSALINKYIEENKTTKLSYKILVSMSTLHRKAEDWPVQQAINCSQN